MSVTALQAAREPLPAGETLGQLIRQSPRGGSRALAGLVTGMGRDLPTVIIANGNHATVRDLISQYGRRMTIEQRLAECTWQVEHPGFLGGRDLWEGGGSWCRGSRIPLSCGNGL